MSLKKSFFRRAINYLTINLSCAKLLFDPIFSLNKILKFTTIFLVEFFNVSYKIISYSTFSSLQ